MKNYQRLLAALFLILSITNSFGQGQTWRWNFGSNAALNFPFGGSPVSTAGSAMVTFEGCASIGTAAGALAMYTDGNKVWGANNVQMPNGFGLFGNSSTTQAAIIVPRPGVPNHYYVFACSSNFSPGNISYSEVDLTLNAGMGDVMAAVKNVVIQTNVSEKLTAVRHCNGVDVWVICHDYTNSDYKAFLVTAAGVNVVPVVSSQGAACSGNVVGCIKTSPNGKKIAYCASNGPFEVHVADFNNSTGVVSNAIGLVCAQVSNVLYGLEFSPDSKILYGSKWAGASQLFQWDLCQATPAAVVASCLMVGSGANTHGQIQLGPDGKIYVARAGATFLGVIPNPNTLGVGCGYNQNGVALSSGSSQYGLPTFIQSYLKTPPPPFTSTMNCLTGQFTAPSFTALVQGCTNSTVNPIQSYLWNFGNPPSAGSNTSALANPTHVFTAAGTYTVKLVLGYACGGDTITGTVTAVNCNPQVQIQGQSICPGQCAVLTATAVGGNGPYTYAWTPNLGVGAGPFTVCPGSTTIYSVTITDANNVTASDTAIVSLNPIPNIVVNSPTACVNGSFALTATGGTAYAWAGPVAYTAAIQSPTLNNVTLAQGGNYTVLVTSNLGCTNTAVALAQVIPLPNIGVIGTNTMCGQNLNGSSNFITLSGTGGSSYAWTMPIGLNASSLNSSPITVTTAVSLVPAITTVTVLGTLGTCTNTSTYTLAIIPNPIIAATSASMCDGTSAQISASGASSYIWSPAANLNTTNAATVIANPPVTSVFSVYGSSLNCNSANVTSTVTVVGNPTLAISPLNPTVCFGAGVVLNATGANNYTWSPATSLSSSSGPNIIASPSVTTNYILIGEAATCTSSITRQVVVIPMPSLLAMASKTSICQGDNTTINANGANSYTWVASTGGLTNPNSNFITVSPGVPTIYSLIGNNGTCSGTLNILIDVIPRPKITLSTSKQRICLGDGTTIFATGAQNYIFTPTLNITMSSNNVANVTPLINTNYTVTGYNTSGTLSCVMTQEILVDVVPTIIPNVSNSATLCAGESTQLTAGGSNSYRWIPMAGLNDANTDKPYANPSITTVYTVTISDFGNCSVTGTVLVQVNPMPTVDAGEDFTLNLDEPMYLNGTGTGTLTWIAGEGIICSACPKSQIMPTNSGVYVIEAVNNFGCKVQDQVKVEVTKDYNIYIPNVFTPNGDGMNDIFLVYGTGITKLEMTIFDRWGEKLFNSKDQLIGWSGLYKGIMSKNDAYVYEINFTTLDNKKHTKTGHVTLLK